MPSNSVANPFFVDTLTSDSSAGLTPLVAALVHRLNKYVGESEKMVRALFRIARERQPSVIFLDEVDSLLSARGDGDQESSRRMKTEFLVQLDGAGTSREDRILLMAATNRPWDLDDALLRRVPRRVLIPLPDATARRVILDGLLDNESLKMIEGVSPDIGPAERALIEALHPYNSKFCEAPFELQKEIFSNFHIIASYLVLDCGDAVKGFDLEVRNARYLL